MHRPLEFAQSISDFVGNNTHRQHADGLYSAREVVGDCGISSDYFWTLCEMPMALICRDSRQWLWHLKWLFSNSLWNANGMLFVGIGVGKCGILSNYFWTLYEMLTNLIPSVWTLVSVALYKKDYICIAYLPSCKHLNDKLSITQNNNNSA